jgi:pimeloyl-ACP methyl ester carboxylesterase
MPHHRHVRLNGIDVYITEQGEGPLVLLLHGFPETSYAWRHQIGALAAAGYHVVAPDQRGYGSTDRPEGIDQYSIFHLVGDVVALIRELGEEQAVVVGHDWGSTVAWHTALLRPDVVRGVVGISVPPRPRGSLPPLTVTKQRFGEDFYQNRFQEPGVAETEMEKDIASILRATFTDVGTAESEKLPAWLTEQDLATFVDQFTASGFTGSLNWYRNLDQNWAQTAAWQDAPITPPSLYISGENDVVRTFYPMDDSAKAIVPNLLGIVNVPDCGHWTQQERPDVINDALLDFLTNL